jgi:hypothetical protein
MTPNQASTFQDAKICFSLAGTPIAAASTSGTVTCGNSVTNIVEFPMTSATSFRPHIDNINPDNTWVTITFTIVPPTGASPDGTGKGIIIITTGGVQVAVNGVMTLEPFQ